MRFHDWKPPAEGEYSHALDYELGRVVYLCAYCRRPNDLPLDGLSYAPCCCGATTYWDMEVLHHELPGLDKQYRSKVESDDYGPLHEMTFVISGGPPDWFSRRGR